MLFYPDQYFYSNRAKPSQSQKPRRQASVRSQFPLGGAGGNSRYSEPPHWAAQPDFDPRYNSQDEYIVLEEDELEALRAYREQKQRNAERAQRQRAAEIARQKAEAERKAREAAQRKYEARIRAQVEANARAAAREYMRRKQERQQALQQALHEERARQQALVLEQLRNQYGLFAVPSLKNADIPFNDTDAQEEYSNEPANEPANKESQEATEQRQQSQADTSEESREGQSQRSAEPDFDPIRSLIEALAPYPFIITTESSDEEEEPQAQSADDTQGADDVSLPEDSYAMGDGPTCETASEDSEPLYSEEPDFRVVAASPPVPTDGDDSSDEAQTKKDRQKERQSKAPKDRVKKAKSAEALKSGKASKAKKSADEVPVPVTDKTSVETCGLLAALKDDLRKMQDGYSRLSSAKPSDNLQEVISRVEAVKIGYRRSEEIYNKLDQIRVGKDQRSTKHQITSDAVALADKYDVLLGGVNKEKEALISSRASSKEGTPDPKPSSDAVHQVTMEEVRDESD